MDYSNTTIEELSKHFLKGTDKIIYNFFKNYLEINYQELQKLGIFNKVSKFTDKK